jgi:lysophospholipase L1-like esterase
MRLILSLLFLASTAAAQTSIPLPNPQIHIFGRYEALPNHDIRLAYPGTGLALRFAGTSLGLTLTANSPKSALTLVLDHGAPTFLLVAQGPQTLTLAQNLTPGPHTLEIYKRTETYQGMLDLTSLQLPAGGELLDPIPLPTRKLLFLGDSVTCGTAVDDTPDCKANPLHPEHDIYNSFGMILGRRLDAQSDLVCFGGRGLQRTYDDKTIKTGTLNLPEFVDLAIPTDNPATQAPWNAHDFIPDAIVISIGTNDFNLEKTQPLDSKSWVADYVKLLHHLRAEYPTSKILATEGAIVTNPLLRQFIQQAVADAHDPNIEWAKATHYPGSSCNGHPTAPQHLKMADDLEMQLRPVLHW